MSPINMERLIKVEQELAILKIRLAEVERSVITLVEFATTTAKALNEITSRLRLNQ